MFPDSGWLILSSAEIADCWLPIASPSSPRMVQKWWLLGELGLLAVVGDMVAGTAAGCVWETAGIAADAADFGLLHCHTLGWDGLSSQDCMYC